MLEAVETRLDSLGLTDVACCVAAAAGLALVWACLLLLACAGGPGDGTWLASLSTAGLGWVEAFAGASDARARRRAFRFAVFGAALGLLRPAALNQRHVGLWLLAVSRLRGPDPRFI